MDQAKAESESGPHPTNEEESLICHLRNASILAETKMEIMQCAVAKCPKVCISAHGIQIPSILHSGSKVTLLQQLYFDQHILPKIKQATGEKANTHNFFKLTVANDGLMPIKMYTKLDLTFLGLKVPKVGTLIREVPNQVLDKKHQTRLPGIVRWNLIQLSFEVFVQKYGTTGFDSFICPEGVILCCFPSCAFSTILMYERTIHWEQHQKSCPKTSNLVSPQRDDLSKEKIN